MIKPHNGRRIAAKNAHPSTGENTYMLIYTPSVM
jgi:hypothetical protein